MLNNPLVRDLGGLSDDSVAVDDGSQIVYLNHVADVIEVLDVPLERNKKC